MLTSNRDCTRQPSYFCYELGFAMQVAVFCLLLWSGKLLVAQTAATGALKGVVTDPSASVIPGASVKVISYTTGQTRTVITQNNGSYLIPYRFGKWLQIAGHRGNWNSRHRDRGLGPPTASRRRIGDDNCARHSRTRANRFQRAGECDRSTHGGKFAPRDSQLHSNPRPFAGRVG